MRHARLSSRLHRLVPLIWPQRCLRYRILSLSFDYEQYPDNYRVAKFPYRPTRHVVLGLVGLTEYSSEKLDTGPTTTWGERQRQYIQIERSRLTMYIAIK